MAIPKVREEDEQLNMESLNWGVLNWVNIEGPTGRETKYIAQK